MMKKLVYLSPVTEPVKFRYEWRFMNSTFGNNGTEDGNPAGPGAGGNDDGWGNGWD